MKYRVEDDLSLFEFHDAIFSFVSFDGNDMVITTNHLNIHKVSKHNPYDFDIEIETAWIIFKNFRSPSYEPGREWNTDNDGKSYPIGPRVIFRGEEAEEKILEELKNSISIFDFCKDDDGTYIMDAFGIEPFFTIRFACDSVLIEWDNEIEKPWYEVYQQLQYDLCLETPEGDKYVEVTVSHNNDGITVKGDIEKEPTINLSCKYDGKEFCGHGDDYFWVDVFADLQKKLPDGVSIKCCLTCRHGNRCPVGNGVNEVFCTKDVVIKQKSDLFFYTEDDGERDKRSREYCYVCENFSPQSDDFYTYNDYLYLLKKE